MARYHQLLSSVSSDIKPGLCMTISTWGGTHDLQGKLEQHWPQYSKTGHKKETEIRTNRLEERKCTAEITCLQLTQSSAQSSNSATNFSLQQCCNFGKCQLRYHLLIRICSLDSTFYRGRQCQTYYRTNQYLIQKNSFFLPVEVARRNKKKSHLQVKQTSPWWHTEKKTQDTTHASSIFQIYPLTM